MGKIKTSALTYSDRCNVEYKNVRNNTLDSMFHQMISKHCPEVCFHKVIDQIIFVSKKDL